MAETFDVVIIGGGPAGLASALYAGRAQLKTVLLEKLFLGGQVAKTYDIENYPGFPDGIDGVELTQRMEKQARRFGAEIRTEEVVGIELDGLRKVVKTRKNEYEALAVIVATGADPRPLGVPGEQELIGRGVSYCATCDAPFFRDKDVVVVGGGDAALKEALYLTKFVRHISLVHRRQGFRAERIYQDEVRKHPKIDLVLDTVAERVVGKDHVEGLEVRNVKTDERSTIQCDGVFVFIGSVPNTEFLRDLVTLAETGHVVTDTNMQTNVDGLYAVGDVRADSYRQIATAVGEGATAALAAEHLIAQWRAEGRI